MKNKLHILNLISAVALAVLFVLLGVLGSASTSVYAATTDSKQVIEDLSKDKNFHQNDYPNIADNYSVQVIQMGESKRKDLYVYVYQPSNETVDLTATKVSISYGYSRDGSGLTPKIYNLVLVSTYSVFDKYIVKNFDIPNDGYRYYNIVEIFREYNETADGEQASGDFDKTDIAYSVGQQWLAYDLNGSKHYEMNIFKTLYVDTVLNGSFEFKSGIQWGNLVGAYSYGNCWFYCFNVEEYIIKHIYDADLNYSIDNCSRATGLGLSGETTINSSLKNQTVTLSDSDKMTFKGDGLFGSNCEWNRILSAKDFVKTAEEQGNSFGPARDTILQSQWVFTYLETELRLNASFGTNVEYFSNVYDVGVLRLHFQDITGKVYDLGTVNDLTDPDNNPDAYGSLSFDEFWDMFIKVIGIILLIVFILILIPFIGPVSTVLSIIFNAVWFVISAPIKFLKKLFKKDSR